MGGLFRAALVDTREFAGCERIDVVLNEVSDTYLKARTDTGIAKMLAPLVQESWDGILASVYRLGIMQHI